MVIHIAMFVPDMPAVKVPVRTHADHMQKSLLQRLYPPRCAFCNGPVTRGYWCCLCDSYLPRMPVACWRCAAPLPADCPSVGMCGACQSSPPPFIRTCAAFAYEFPVNTALKAMKFSRQLHYVPAFSAALLPLITMELQDVDALLPVPLHRWRHLQRGFNQAAELCRPLARTTGLRVLRNVRRIRATATQSGLKAEQRRRNLTGAFHVNGRLGCRHPADRGTM